MGEVDAVFAAAVRRVSAQPLDIQRSVGEAWLEGAGGQDLPVIEVLDV